jgi:hypothetical protein
MSRLPVLVTAFFSAATSLLITAEPSWWPRGGG